MGRFHTAGEEDIREGRVTDVYFKRTLEALEARGLDKQVRAEVFAKKLPASYGWGVFAGVEELGRLMEGKKVDIRCMDEGEVFFPWEPVLEVSGSYREFCLFETAMLGLICQSTGVATKSARVRLSAGGRLVVSFGARRMHPAIAPMIERAAFIGGADGVSVLASAELLEVDPMGTMPHALILVMGDTVEAVRAFDESAGPEVKRVALIDTFNDEKFESLRVAEALGEKLYAVRLDTPSSRRGDFYRILEEVRWELDLRGYGDVKLFASGGLDEVEVGRLSPLVDAFGVGTSISNAPVVDFSMDIVEIDGKPSAKRGKMSGAKDLLLCPACTRRAVVPLGSSGRCASCGGGMNKLLKPLVDKGRITRELPKPAEIRRAVLERIKGLEL
ncbi:nicotinate phosphoribosyltransferase [Gammaproteobacteria bacterium]|nr:nicotinate phosphoribosyltransferase [Gammaproteobacteria bacterium]